MSALFIMRYAGTGRKTAGALYWGDGIIIGVDDGGAKYDGNYCEIEGRMQGAMTITVPSGCETLVTGRGVRGPASVDLTFDFPADFDNGQPNIMAIVGGAVVRATFERIKNVQ
jgi:hypothetical protein